MQSTRTVSKSRSIAGFLLGTFGFMLGALGLLYIALWGFAPRDAAAPDTRNLAAKLEVVPPEQGAITARLETLKAFRLEPNQFFQTRGWSNSEANRLLDEYKPDLANFEAFSKLERFVSPALDPQIDSFERFNAKTINPSLLNIAKLADLMLVRAELKGRSSDPKGFLEDLLIVARVSKLERNAGGTLIEYLIGSKMLRLSLERLRAGMLSLDMKPTEWKSRLDALASLAPTPEELQNAVKTEFRMQQLAVRDAPSRLTELPKILSALNGQRASPSEQIASLLPERYNFQPNTTLGWFVDYAKGMIDASPSCPPDRSKLQPFINQALNQSNNVFAPNAVGQLLFAYLAPSAIATDARCKLSTDLAATITVAALRGFQLETKNLPKNLSELEGKYLSKLPIDPYSGSPLELNLPRRILQSKSGATFKLGF
jgi:hypothetical protein